MLRLTHRTSRRLRFSLPPRNLYSLSSNSRAQNHTECKNEPRNLEQVSSSSINDLNPHSYHPRDLYSSSSSNFSDSRSQNHTECKNLERNLQQVSSSSIVNVNHHSLSSLSSPSRSTVFLLSATVLSATATAAYLLFSGENTGEEKKVYSTIEDAINRSNESAKRIIHRMKQTGAAAAVLWQSLRSVMSSANYEVRLGFEFRVAAFLADIAAANASRRAAIVAAGGGKVVDWLLEMVAAPVAGDRRRTQAEAARALAYLIADSNVNKEVLGRPHAVANILRFIFFSQPQGSKKNPRPSSFDVSDSLKGRSMLVAAVMDIVTSSCESLENIQFLPTLPAHAEMRDIAAAIQVIEGGMHLDDPHANEDEGGSGLKGIGIKVLGETTILGLSRTSGVMKYADNDDIESSGYTPRNVLHQKRHENFLGDAAMSSPVVPGLWDDLHSEHVAVPFATWALANWAMASQANRSHIQDLDHDGHAIKTALAAPERSVKWHGSLVARFLLEDDSIQLNDFISDWSSSLLSTISQACKSDDIPLAQVALSAFLLSLERSPGSRKAIMDKGLDLMRNTAKRTTEHKNVQESLAKALELICTDDLHLPLEESQKWSGILLSWACRKSSPEKLRSSAIKILSGILEDFGPASIPISQGWLTILLTEVLNSIKTSSKGGSQPKSDKVKTQLGQLNIQSAGQIASQLTSSVVNLAAKQLGPPADPVETFPLAGFLSQEPFAGPFKSLNKDRSPKFHAADAATATLKGIKALAEVCAEDPLCQNQISDSGVLCLLRRFLMKDDYEKLAAIEAYDASVVREAQEPESNDPSESTVVDTNDTSSVRVPPSSHIRRHAARLLTILSALPKVQKVIIADKTLCKWLEDCATGLIPGCSDVKIQSYARATLLNVLCTEKGASDPRSNGRSGTGIVNETRACRRYDDMIFLINPSSPHWKCPEKPSSGTSNRNSSSKDDDYSAGATSPNNNISSEGDAIDNKNGYLSTSNNGSLAEVPPMDVIFIHGMRGGPFKTWRISEDKSSTKSGLVERIDQEAGKQGTFWPGEWLSADFPDARLFTLKYKTNLTQWSGASLPLQEVSSMLLEKIVAAGIGNHPVVFVTHSMGGLIVKQMLYQAKAENLNDLVNNTVGVVFYSCPHFGSKLADLPWRMGLVLRPAPTIGELRSGSPRLVELNDFMRRLHKKGSLEVLSFSETKVTPLVEGYGGWAFRMEIVPIESAYPGYGDIVVLESTDHINSCKPLSRDDPSYTEIVEFLRKLKAHYT